MDRAERDRRLLALVGQMQEKTYKPKMGRPMKPNPVILSVQSLSNPKAKVLAQQDKPADIKALEDWLDGDKTAR